MNIAHLETFLTVCECKNISEAAKRLFIPQPTVSNRIRFMEESLGHELFIRSKKGVELTAQGQAFLPYAEHIIQTYQLAIGQLNSKLHRNDLNIGSTLPFTFPFILDKLQALYSSNPDLNLQMLSVDIDDVVRSLAERTIDMAFTTSSLIHADVEKHQIGSEGLHLVLSAEHPLAKEKDAPRFLSGELEFVVYYQIYYEMYQDHPWMNLPHKRRFLTNHAGLIKQMIVRMGAVSVLPLSFVSGEIKRGELTSIPLKEAGRSLRVPYYLMFRKNERYYEQILLAPADEAGKNAASKSFKQFPPADAPAIGRP